MSYSYSKLIDDINALKNVDFSNVWEEFERNEKAFANHLPSAQHLNSDPYLKSKDDLLAAIAKYKEETEKCIARLQRTLDEAVPAFLAQNQQIYHSEFEQLGFKEEFEWHKSQPPKDRNRNSFIDAVNSKADWRYPAIIYGSKGSNLPIKFTSFDPIYVVDDHPEYFDVYKEMFLPEQARKFKYYSWQERNLLPVGVGCIAIFNEFPYRTIDQIKDKLAFFNKLLLPGGLIGFNYNDCRTGKNMAMVENRIMTYNSYDIMSKITTDMGLEEMLSNSHTDEYFSWMVCSKPGQLPLIKLGASMGAIDRKAELFSKTTRDEHHTYIKKAIIKYNIDSNDKK